MIQNALHTIIGFRSARQVQVQQIDSQVVDTKNETNGAKLSQSRRLYKVLFIMKSRTLFVETSILTWYLKKR